MQQQEPLKKPDCKRCHLALNAICTIIRPIHGIKPLFHKKSFIAIYLVIEYIHPPSFITNQQHSWNINYPSQISVYDELL